MKMITMDELRVIWMAKKNKLPTKIFIAIFAILFGFLLAFLATRCWAWFHFNDTLGSSITDQYEYANWMFYCVLNGVGAMVFTSSAIIIPIIALTSLDKVK